MARVSSVASALARLLAPDRCPGCDLVLCSAAPGFCPACAPLLERPPVAQRAPGLAASAYVYCGPLADAICRLKYAARTEIAPILGALLAEGALAYAGRVDRVLALPLHPARLRERGFNQSALLARPVARALGVALDVHSLRRTRPTCDQASLPRERRADNVRGAFAVVRRPEVGRVLLIDDVRTTGATMAAAGEVLLDAGYGEVHTLALAQS